VAGAAATEDLADFGLEARLVLDRGGSFRRILRELGENTVELGLVQPDIRLGLGVTFVRAFREQGGPALGVLADGFEPFLDGCQIERRLAFIIFDIAPAAAPIAFISALRCSMNEPWASATPAPSANSEARTILRRILNSFFSQNLPAP